jgi:hypothetical protein
LQEVLFFFFFFGGGNTKFRIGKQQCHTALSYLGCQSPPPKKKSLINPEITGNIGNFTTLFSNQLNCRISEFLCIAAFLFFDIAPP